MARGNSDDHRTLQAAFNLGEISPRLHARMDLAEYQTGLALCRNFVTSAYGGVRNRAGTRFIAYAGDETRRPRLIPFRFSIGAGQAYVLELGHQYLRVFMDGAQVVYPPGDPNEGDPVQIATTYTESQLPALRYVQSADVMTLTHPDHPVRELTRTDHHAWSLTDVSFAPSLATPGAGDLTLTQGGAGSGTNFTYVISWENESGEESLPSPAETIAHASSLSSTNYVNVAITYPYPAGVVYANVYKYRGGVYGWIGNTADGSFRDDGISPQLNSTPPRSRNPFSGSGNRPGAVAYYQQRLALGGTSNAPETLHLSQTGAFHNFSISEPLRDSDAVTATLAGEQVDQIRHLVALGNLVVLTRGGVWTLRRGDKGLTPALEGGLHFETAFGTSLLRPIVIGGACVYVQEGQRIIRAAEFDLGRDGLATEDVGLRAEHLLRDSGAYEWAFQQTPGSLLWIVRDDGALLSVAYLKDQRVSGWSRHDTQEGTLGRFESVAVVPEGNEDAVYFVVKRRLGAQWRRCIERMASRDVADVRDGFFVDCGLSLDSPVAITGITVGATYLTVTAAGHGLSNGDWIDLSDIEGLEGLNGRRLVAKDVAGATFRLYESGADLDSGVDTYLAPSAVSGTYLSGGYVRKAVSTVSGLDHLEGESVSVLADGNVEGPYEVEAGVISLLRPASRVHVGIGFTSTIRTLPIASAASAEMRARIKRVVSLQIHLESSRAIWAGPSLDQLEEHIQRTDELLGDPTALKSGLIELTIPSTWNEHGQVYVQVSDPLPCEILGISPAFEVGS